jgi:hypothetical protein
MLPPPLRALYVAAFVIIVSSPMCRPCAAADQKGSTAAGVSTPNASGQNQTQTPANATPTADPVAENCKKALAGLGSGDTAALKALPQKKLTVLVDDDRALKVFTCLAIADDSGTYCESLPERTRNECVQHWHLVRELKGLPKESLKAEIIYRACFNEREKEDCDRIREAILAHDSSKCSGIAKPWDSFCAAFSTGDAGKCTGLVLAEERGLCAALATDDPSRCVKDSKDCINMARDFAIMKTQGFAGAGISDPTVGAAIKGRKACAPLIADWQAACAPAQTVVTPGPSAAPGGTP